MHIKQKKRSVSRGSVIDEVKDARAEEQKAARTKYLWGRLRDTILDTVNASLENDAKERVITHGVHHLRQISHRHKIKQGMYIPEAEVMSQPLEAYSLVNYVPPSGIHLH